jgi:hypothetical protein
VLVSWLEAEKMKSFTCAEDDWDDVVSAIGLLHDWKDPRISGERASEVLEGALLAPDVDTETTPDTHAIILSEQFTNGGRRPGGFGWSLGVLLRGVGMIAKLPVSPEATEANRILPVITRVVTENLAQA